MDLQFSHWKKNYFIVIIRLIALNNTASKKAFAVVYYANYFN